MAYHWEKEMDIIKEIKIKQMKELDEFIEDYNGSGWVFRGQKSDYDLIPSALRNNENEKEDNGRTFLKEANDKFISLINVLLVR